MTLKQKTIFFSILALLVIFASTATFLGYRSINNRLMDMVFLLEEMKFSAHKIGDKILLDQPDLRAIKKKIKAIPDISRQFQTAWGTASRPARLVDLEISFIRVGRVVDKSLPGTTLEKPLRQQIHHETDRIEAAVDALLIHSQKKIADLQGKAEIMISVLSIALIAYIMGVLYFLSRMVIRPILTLSQQIEEVRAGRQKAIPPLARKDEIGRLYDFARRTIAELAQKNIALGNEIQEKQAAEERYKQSTATLENVLNSSNPLCITGIDYDLMLANKAYYELWPKKNVGQGRIKCYESRPGALCHAEDCPLNQILQGKEMVRVETTKTEGDGLEHYFIITARPFRDAEGKLIGMVESFQDITERKVAEEALASERESLAVTLRSIGEGVITTDTTGRIVLINKTAEQLTGWNQTETIGKSLQEVLHIITGKNRQQKDTLLEEILRTGKITGPEDNTILVEKTGAEREIALSGAPIKKEQADQIIGVVLVFRDVSEENRLEQELLKAKKLESIGILAGGIAHDFNNILTGIMGNLNLASLHVPPGEKIHDLLYEAEKASVRAKGLTQQLLTFSKGGAPHQKTFLHHGAYQGLCQLCPAGRQYQVRLSVPARSLAGENRSRPDKSGYPEYHPQRKSRHAQGRGDHGYL